MTKGALSGKAGEAPHEEFKINGQYVNTPEKSVVGILFFDGYVEKAELDYLDESGKKNEPFFMSVVFMKVHQPNMPAPEFEHKSLSKTRHAGSVVENDTRIGHIMDKVRELGLDKNTYVFWTSDNGAWQDVYPTRATRPSAARKAQTARAAAACPRSPGAPGSRPTRRIPGSSAGSITWRPFAALGGAKLPDKDREGQPIIFDSMDMTPVLFGTDKSPRDSWFYLTESELTPGAARVGNYKAVFNLRGDDGVKTGGLAVDSNLGWKGPESHVATVPQVFDLWQDPQERYDVFMNNFTGHTWILVSINASITELMKTYVKYPPRKLQSEKYTGPITLTQYERFK